MSPKQNRSFKSKCFQYVYRNKWIKNINMYHAGVNVILVVANVTQIKRETTINISVSVKIWKNITCAKNYIWNPATCSCENGKYVASTIDDSVVMCNEIIEETKAIPKAFPASSSSTKFYIVLTFLLITKHYW